MARDWLKLAKESYMASTTYVDANYRKKWDDALKMFQSRHPSGSKYNTDAYKHRSKIFRPKTRSLVRKHEAAIAAAFFSNVDVISTSPENEDDPKQAASAAVMKELLQYRLTKSIPWFQVLCGGMQDAMTVGVVCSYQYWKYREVKGETQYQPVLDQVGNHSLDENGNGQYTTFQTKKIVEDKPCVELIPVENIRFDPAADWTNPAVSSPYLIRMIPMYICDIKQQMVGKDSNGKSWKKLDDGQIKSSMKQENDPTTQTREQNRQSTTDTGNAPIGDYEIAWVHENFMRIDGQEMVYFTLGVEHLLSDPVEIHEVYFTGERPIIIGSAILETHKAMPESPVMIAEQLQREANEIVNQRLDNVKLVLNKRYIVKRGAQVDLKSIVRNVPGSITLANDTAGDVRELEFSDVTSSSYQEQDRLNVDYDELTGNFSQGSVMTNRKIGETVGGMGMISNAANQITEYTIRTITETWVERVVRQLAKLEAKYETDEVVLAIAANKANLFQKYGISQINDDLLNQELTLNINVGMGATDPTQKLNKFMGAIQAYGTASQIPGANVAEIGKEIFGLAGYRDGARFLMQQGDPAQQLAQVTQQAQGMQQHIQLLTQQLQQTQGQLQDAKSGVQTQMMKQQIDGALAQQKNNNDMQLGREKAIADRITKVEVAEIAAGSVLNQQQVTAADNG